MGKGWAWIDSLRKSGLLPARIWIQTKDLIGLSRPFVWGMKVGGVCLSSARDKFLDLQKALTNGVHHLHTFYQLLTWERADSLCVKICVFQVLESLPWTCIPSKITDNCKTVKLQKPCLHLETGTIKLETAFLKSKFSWFTYLHLGLIKKHNARIHLLLTPDGEYFYGFLKKFLN